MSKYGAKKVIVTADGTIFDVDTIKQFKLDIDGVRCDSRMEGEYLSELQQLKREGAIMDIECHPSFDLQSGITYIADFKITFSDGKKVIVDVKGFETAAFRMKSKMFKSNYPDLELRIITKYCGRWMSTKEVKQAKSTHKKAVKKLLNLAAEQERSKHERQPKR
jgi:hypothetical protein